VIPNRPYRLRHLRLALTVILPCASLADRARLQEAIALREAMIGTLRSVYLHGHVWDAADLVHWCARILNPQESVHGTAPVLRYDPDRALRDQIVAGDTLQRVSAEGLRFGAPGGADETVVKAFSVRSYPPAYGPTRWGRSWATRSSRASATPVRSSLRSASGPSTSMRPATP
jgi:conjugal transfer ATP-binding protein TraC